MYKAIVNNRHLEITSSADGHFVNGEPVALDVVSVGSNYFHVLYKNKGFRAEVVKADVVSKTFTIKINGNTYDIEVRNKFDLLLEQMGMKNGLAAKVNHIKAPMPGLIIDLRVKEGDVVKQNDPLIILEAMKMENVIKSPGDGTVKAVKVQKGNSVEKNQVLIEF
jgi:biotin carboxyl carrier protein